MKHASSRLRWSATVLLTGVTAAAATLLVSTSGGALGSPSASQYEYGHPAPLAAPTISGTAKVGQKLTTTDGTWSSSSAIRLFAYAWGRCDGAGNNCAAIAGATSNTYVLGDADQGHTIRSYVTATNATGPTQNASAATGVVQASLPTGKQIPAAQVTLPNRLVIDNVKYSANPIRARTSPTQMQVHVADTRQNGVQGALVFVEGLPYSRVAPMPEARTDGNGWVTVALQPAQFFPRKGYLTLFVRARVQGQDLLGGTSTRRLVQVTIAPPNG
jgi:hypothetical protein